MLWISQLKILAEKGCDSSHEDRAIANVYSLAQLRRKSGCIKPCISEISNSSMGEDELPVLL